MRWMMIGAVVAWSLVATVAAAQSGGAAAPAVQLAEHDYLVFFRADEANLTPQAQVIVARAAKAAKLENANGKLGHVKVIGYSSATGGPGAAEKLATARAEAIRQALVSEGLEAASVRVEGRGRRWTKDAKPDAVAELVNRRARIVLYGPGK
jgi:OmpA-OmpF porin, OOP family